MPQIRYFDNLPTIARVNRYTGDIDVNEKQINALPSLIQRFIFEHENGHFKLQTSNELEADYYAFTKVAGTEKRSLKYCVEALTNVLNFENPEHYKRLNAMLINALVYDYRINKNQKAFEALVLILNKNQMNTKYNNFDSSGLLNALGGVVGTGNSNANSGAKDSSGGGSFDWNQAIAVGGQILNGVNQTNKPATSSTSKIDAVIQPNINLGTNKSTLDTQVNWEASLNNSNQPATKDNTLLYVAIGFVAVLVIGVATYFIVKNRR